MGNHEFSNIDLSTISDKFAIAVSGGADSTYLAIAAIQARPELDHHLIYINHQLRPDENKKEIKHIQQLAKSTNSTAHILPINLTSHTQDAFRNERLLALTNQCKSLDINHLLLGHHLNDDVETVMFQFFRGATSNLRGIPTQSEFNGIKLHHPLLHMSKREILNQLSKLGQQFIEDSSNQSLVYDRNKIRQWLNQNPIKQSDQCNHAALTYLKENEALLKKQALTLKTNGLTIDGTILIPKTWLKATAFPNHTLKIIIESLGHNYVNQAHMSGLNNALENTHETIVNFDHHQCRMDYKWIEIKQNNHPPKINWDTPILGQFCGSSFEIAYNSTNDRLCIPLKNKDNLNIQSVYECNLSIKNQKKYFSLSDYHR